MKRKVLQGAMLFNDYWLGSCYYHQLIAGLGVLGLDGRDVLLNRFLYFKKDLDAEEGVTDEKTAARYIGYKEIRKNLTRRGLVRYIEKGMPVIVGVDCFYLESRADTYGQHHDPHLIMVYGFDLGKGELYVTDHNYKNSYFFMEKSVSMENIFKANREYRRGIARGKTTCIVLKRRKKKGDFDFLRKIAAERARLEESRINAAKSFERLKEMFAAGGNAVREGYGKAISLIEKAKRSRQLLSCTALAPVMGDAIEELVCIYTFFTALLWKMERQNDFGYAKDKLDKIFRKFDRAAELENRIHLSLEEGI